MPDWLAQQTVIVKQAADLHSNMLSQVITAEYLSLNRLDNQIALIREDYRKKCVALADALESRLGEHLEFSRPQGGMFLWARFRYPFDSHGMDGRKRWKTAWCTSRVKRSITISRIPVPCVFLTPASVKKPDC